MGTIPERYELEPGINKKLVLSRKYKNWTVGDLLEMFADTDPETTVWIETLDADGEDTHIRPIETMHGAGSFEGKPGYIMLG